MVRAAGDPLNGGAVQPAGDCDCDFSRLSQQRQLQPVRRSAQSVGTVLIAERTLVRQLRNILPVEHDVHRRIVSYLVAFSWSLKHQLRKTDPTADLRRLLPDDKVAEILASSMPTNRILLLVGNEIGQLREAGKLSDITYGLMDNKLDELAHVLGGCERLATTPVPFAYTLILQRTVYLFCTLLPFALVGDLHYMTPFVSVFISYTFCRGIRWRKSWKILSVPPPMICR